VAAAKGGVVELRADDAGGLRGNDDALDAPGPQDTAQPGGGQAFAPEKKLLRLVAVLRGAGADVGDRHVLVGAIVQFVVGNIVADDAERGAHAASLGAADHLHEAGDLRVWLVAGFAGGAQHAGAGGGGDLGRVAQDARDRHRGHPRGGGDGGEAGLAGGGRHGQRGIRAAESNRPPFKARAPNARRPSASGRPVGCTRS
jgi:hypothetical protein